MESLLYGDEKFADIILICRHREFHAHRVIVCKASDWIDQACKNAYKVFQFSSIIRSY